MNQHCGKHDKIFNESHPCPGCETEKNSASVVTETPKAEESTEEKVQRHVREFEAKIRQTLGV